jgi:hypothetical protein
VLFIISCVFGVGAALLRGGRLSNLSKLSVRWSALPLLALTLQFYVLYGPGKDDADRFGFSALLILGSYVLLLGVAMVNHHLPGMVWLGLGVALNFFVILSNGGWMPVTSGLLVKAGYIDTPDAVVVGQRAWASKDVVMASQDIRLRWLSDLFVIPRAGIFSAVFSAGDALMMLGLFLLIQAGMMEPAERES